MFYFFFIFRDFIAKIVHEKIICLVFNYDRLRDRDFELDKKKERNE